MGQNGSRSYQIQLCHFVLTSLLQDALLYHGASALSSPPRAAAAENAAGRRRRRTEAPKSAKKPSPTGGVWPLGSAKSGHFRFGSCGDAARRTEKQQYAPLRGGKHKGETSRRAFSPRLGEAGAVFRRLCADRRILLCAGPSRLPCRFSGFAQMALRPDCRSFSQASCRRRHAARLRALPSAASPLRLREGGSPRSARRSPAPPYRCPAGGNNRRWRP